MASNLKEKHNIMVRDVVRAVAHLQGLMDDDATPGHVKPHLLACMELLDRGLMGRDMEDEKVLIEVSGGIAYVASKTEYVEVTIHDLDNSFEG